MQFITNGPDIPNALLQAHEEGRVVFFCGAGISYPAGLPGFGGLVDRIYQITGTERTETEEKTFDSEQFDVTLGLLERRLPGQRRAVRRALTEALKPKLRRKGSTDTHAAILHLARNREGTLRLVTTNFDRVFHMAAKRLKLTFQEYTAPMLPIPKDSRWDGLVYLHGLLPKKVDDTALNRLVVTSGDFGLAYLTERWAARFVSELFRNYVVLFVGYSITDPVLRYMMDALAADRMLGETTPQAWAIGSCALGQERQKSIEWQAKGVTPILYNLPEGSDDHSALHETLQSWASTYHNRIQGKEAIVVRHALAKPQDSTQQDDFVGRMLWALSDKSGLPAKRFAYFNPVPPLEWLLEAFTDECFGHGDLIRFDVVPRNEFDAELRFNLVSRPAPYNLSQRMLLASGGPTGGQWDRVMPHIAFWLTRHLDDPRLIIWIAERGGQLHERWSALIEDKLERFASLERTGKTAELDEIRLHAPMAVPGPLMRTLWRILLIGRVKSPWRKHDLYSWKRSFKQEGLTTILRLKLRELLAPHVALKRPFHWDDDISTDEPTRIKQLVDCEVVLASDHVQSTLRDLAGEQWTEALPHLLKDFQSLLRDALDLLSELGEADHENDPSHWDLPSIISHRQNRGFRDWVSLIELLRDAWLAVYDKDKVLSTHIAQSWFVLPYPTFKRLALFAASHDDCIPPEKWVDWLLADGAWWLWSIDTRREVLRLFVLQGRRLTGASQERLEACILAGPPRRMFRDDLEPGDWQGLVAHSVWLHLAKLNTSGLVMGTPAIERLEEISEANPLWKLMPNESDEFSHWMSGTGDPDYEDSREVDVAPNKRKDLVQWLQKPKQRSWPRDEDTWSVVCRKHMLNSLCALSDLAHNNEWPIERWNEALRVWSEARLVKRSWRYASSLVEGMPDKVLQSIVHSVTRWMEAASKSIALNEDLLLKLCNRVLALPLEAGSGITRNGVPIEQPVTEAINHPIGKVTEALINLWFKQNPNDDEQISNDIKPFFAEICNVQIERFRHGRVLLASQLIALFRVDRLWTEQNLMPLFSWDNSSEAKAVWQGFLWSPRLYQPLLTTFKPQFLETAKHYTKLGEFSQQFAAFLTYVALSQTEGYSVNEFRSAFGALPQDGLEEATLALAQLIESATDRREDYWKKHAQPFWQEVWPKKCEMATPRIAEYLSRVAIAAGDEFPRALTAVQDWLQPLKSPDYIISLLSESGLCRRFPKEAMLLLDLVVNVELWLPRELRKCLTEIVEAAPEIAQEIRYQRLHEFLARF